MLHKHILHYIGLYAPGILLCLSLFFLRNMKHHLRFFTIGFILNTMLNILLKISIKEPRPSEDHKKLEIAIAHGEQVDFNKLGMPSCHAQNCAYCLIFIATALSNPLIIMIYLVFTIISICQRYISNEHSILQLLVGLIVGSAFAYLMYWVTNKHITGNIKMRADDYGPF